MLEGLLLEEGVDAESGVDESWEGVWDGSGSVDKRSAICKRERKVAERYIGFLVEGTYVS